MFRVLKPGGYQVNVRNIFIGIRRDSISGIDFIDALHTGRETIIPVRFIGEWSRLRIVVEQIIQFSDGMLVCSKPNPGCILENWPNAKIWVPRTGPIGVLMYTH